MDIFFPVLAATLVVFLIIAASIDWVSTDVEERRSEWRSLGLIALLIALVIGEFFVPRSGLGLILGGAVVVTVGVIAIGIPLYTLLELTWKAARRREKR
jgi:uncharacterized protein YqgC (DUF456 family)